MVVGIAVVVTCVDTLGVQYRGAATITAAVSAVIDR